MPGVTKEQIQAAREADLFAWLQSHEPGVLKRDGPNYRHKEHDSLVYVTGKRYWYWNSRGRSINALDYLIQIRGYGLVDAVQALAGGEIRQTPAYQSAAAKQAQREPEKKPFTLPWARRCATAAVSYLQQRGRRARPGEQRAAELPQEEDQRHLARLIGELPVPGAIGIGAAKGALHLKSQTQRVDLEALGEIGLQSLGHGEERGRGRGIARWNRNGRRNRREIGHRETPEWGTGTGPDALSRAPSGLIFPGPSLPLEPVRSVRSG